MTDIKNKVGSNLPRFSIIIPTYNEEQIIYNTLKKVDNYFSGLGEGYEIILSDDGSTDRTVDIVLDLNIPDLKVLQSYKNIGKGMAVKRGVMAAQGAYIFFTDADLSSPIKEFQKLFAHKEKDIIVGSRAVNDSEVQTTLKRKMLGRIGHLFISGLAVKGIKDTQCGFKLFKGPVAKRLFLLQRLNRYGFDFEILYLAQKYHYSIEEVPVKWIISKDSKVRPMDYLYTFIELLFIRHFEFLGKYGK